jgi:cysteine desulfurase
MGYEVTYLPFDRHGIVDIDALKRSIKKDTILVTIMAANNEIGTIQPIKEIAEIVRESGIYFHTDGVQVVGKIPVSLKKLDVDMLSFSGHKFYGPNGIGALYVRNGIKLNPFIYGGGQEKSKRAGTENVAGIVGLGKAAEIAIKEMEEEGSKVKSYEINLRKE